MYSYLEILLTQAGGSVNLVLGNIDKPEDHLALIPEEMAAAHDDLASGHAIGKLVVTV